MRTCAVGRTEKIVGQCQTRARFFTKRAHLWVDTSWRVARRDGPKDSRPIVDSEFSASGFAQSDSQSSQPMYMSPVDFSTQMHSSPCPHIGQGAST